MSTKQNDILREQIWEEANEIVQLMIDDKDIAEEQRDTMVKEVYNSLWEERDWDPDSQIDDNSGDEQ